MFYAIKKEKNNKRGLICTFETKSGEPFYAEKKLKSKKMKIKDSTQGHTISMALSAIFYKKGKKFK